MPSPEHRHSQGFSGPRHGGSLSWEPLHASDSSQTGSKLGPLAAQFQGPRGSGHLGHMEPFGTVPSLTSQPRSVVLKKSCSPPTPPQRREELPTNRRGVFWKHSSLSASPAGHRRYW